MKRYLIFLLISISYIFPFAYSQQQNQEILTITTYYPAPFGVYQNLRLFPIAPEPDANCTADTEGTIYYNKARHQVMICGQDSSGNPGWQSIGLWDRNGNDIFLTDNNWNVGIGTGSPVTKLDVIGGIKIGDHNRGATNCVGTEAGIMRYNSSNNTIEYCNGTSWGQVGGGDKLISYVASAGTWVSFGGGPYQWTDFTIPKPVDADYVLIEVGGSFWAASDGDVSVAYTSAIMDFETNKTSGVIGIGVNYMLPGNCGAVGVSSLAWSDTNFGNPLGACYTNLSLNVVGNNIVVRAYGTGAGTFKFYRRS